MVALVNKFCSADFIRVANKWGPIGDNGEGAYALGDIDSLTPEALRAFGALQLTHVLYYLQPHQLSRCLYHMQGGKALAVIHKHDKTHGFINDGEQEYWVRGGIVKQKDVVTGSCYYHPNITPFWFREEKVWYPTSGDADPTPLVEGTGIAWELHFVCEDTWIVEIVAANKSEIYNSTAQDWKNVFDDAVEVFDANVQKPAVVEPLTVLPRANGKFIELDVTCIELFSALRLQASGKSRVGSEGRKLFESLISTARHLIKPGMLFPGKDGLACPEHLIIDHVVSAYVTDIARETDVMKAVGLLFPHLRSHAHSVSGVTGSKFNAVSAMDFLRASVKVGIAANKVVRSADPIGTGLHHLDSALGDY
jgi:hypothetical protein